VTPEDGPGFGSTTRGGTPVADAYLLVDSTLCTGCRNCMLACSLVHEGRTSLSLSRIQVLQDVLERFPQDIVVKQCRQCARPYCLEACPTGALHADAANGNVRTVNVAECNGCEMCIDACPYTPGMMIWHREKGVAVKCDLCALTPYWSESGGPAGRQACFEVCPMKAIGLTKDMPAQDGDEGYDVDLRQAG
jgi:protein NrfC